MHSGWKPILVYTLTVPLPSFDQIMCCLSSATNQLATNIFQFAMSLCRATRSQKWIQAPENRHHRPKILDPCSNSQIYLLCSISTIVLLSWDSTLALAEVWRRSLKSPIESCAVNLKSLFCLRNRGSRSLKFDAEVSNLQSKNGKSTDWAGSLRSDAADRLFLNCSRVFCKITETKVFAIGMSRLDQHTIIA